MVKLTRRRTLTVLGSSVSLSLVAPSAAAATNGSISADPAAPGATSTHTVTVTVDGDAAGSSWNSLVVDYAGTGTDVSDVGADDLTAIGIDRDDDAGGTAVDDDVSDDVSSVDVSNDGQTLTVGLGGSYSLESGDELVGVFEDVQNPDEAGSANVTLTVNHQSAAESTDATLETSEPTEGDSGDGSSGDTDDSGDGCTACATVAFDDQASAGDAVHVDSVFLPDGGFVVVHRADGTVVGNSEYLDAGSHEDVRVSLSATLSQDRTLTAMAHRDTNGNETYEFPDADGPYACGGEPVTDEATVTVETC